MNLYDKALKTFAVSNFGMKVHISTKTLFQDVTETVVKALT